MSTESSLLRLEREKLEAGMCNYLLAFALDRIDADVQKGEKKSYPNRFVSDSVKKLKSRELFYVSPKVSPKKKLWPF
jgi:hypothetical protein